MTAEVAQIRVLVVGVRIVVGKVFFNYTLMVYRKLIRKTRCADFSLHLKRLQAKDSYTTPVIIFHEPKKHKESFLFHKQGQIVCGTKTFKVAPLFVSHKQRRRREKLFSLLYLFYLFYPLKFLLFPLPFQSKDLFLTQGVRNKQKLRNLQKNKIKFGRYTKKT